MWLVATKTIMPGEQLLCHYSKTYKILTKKRRLSTDQDTKSKHGEEYFKKWLKVEKEYFKTLSMIK